MERNKNTRYKQSFLYTEYKQWRIQDFCQKLHENERNWTHREAVPLMIKYEQPKKP